MRALLAIALAACGSSAPSPEPALAGYATRPAPTTPAPRISYRDARFDAPALPAIARDGAVAVVAMIDHDSGRGFPNLRIEVRDRKDRVVENIGVMTANEFETLVPDGTTATPELERRIAAGNSRLAALHAEHDLVTMQALALKVDPLGPSQPARGDGLVVTFDADHTLRVRASDRVVATANGTSWLVPSGKRCAQCEPCENPPYLAAVYKATGITAIVVRIAYRGTDTCWEPADQLHLIGW
jgi:hypothetical protein